MTDDGTGFDRREVLGVLAGFGSASLAGCAALQSDPDAETTQVDADRARELAERFAPTLYFDKYEKWYPTDPRQYTSDRDGDTVVHGFDAVEGYHSEFDDEAEPPEPMAFYNVVSYDDSSLAVVQYWHYYVFDQFSCNFHWHDWEVLHVFVDTETGEPQLHVASSHSRDVPNNEFLDPDPDTVPRVLPELGSHSSTLSLNDVPDRFQRFGGDDLIPDVTNEAIEQIGDLVDLPFAYGLPRDEGARLPMVIPELDGVPLYEHDAVPSFTRESLIAEELTVRSLAEIESPPTDLPLRETGLVFEHEERDGDSDADVTYGLRPTSDIEHISGFTGPQLSFEFPIPDLVEDAVSHHISTTGTPWEQPRYENPAADITASAHRTTLANRYDVIGDPGLTDTLITRVTEATTDEDAPDDEGLTTVETTQEAVALLESEPRMRPTFGGVAVFGDVEPGEHRLTVNAAGSAPHSERLEVADDGDRNDDGSDGGDDADNSDDSGDSDDSDDDSDGSEESDDSRFRRAGVDGEVPVVPRDKATRLELSDEESGTDVVRTAVEDDFAGRIYGSAVDGSDAVFVHEGGAYTTEVRDPDDEVGVYRVNPEPGSESPVRIDRPETGKASIAGYLADVAEETRASVAAVGETADDEDGDDDDDDDDDEGGSDRSGNGNDANGAENAVQGLERAMAAVVKSAERARERARDGDRGGADQQLEAVTQRLETVGDRLAEARGDLPAGLSNAAEHRLEQADRRADQAQAAEKL